ncbi:MULTISPECIES: GNAT family N-acetyltransferase [Roseobacteraceae]|uniref:Putative N-acetyltransferase YjcF n=1 Tax=Pseudosulfitobacter pseudonitzschiae TaxID=1402135 RepID=A0A221K4V8_9RHOB|nr:MULTISPECIES: GNAT family N-acetyltransferase [Roseobacteraceae]ASM74038.1 putative N-acetyltransferase YjcF [Pseudosulfitobacter pseudonitzschiae]
MTVEIAQTRDITTCRALRRTVFIEEQHVPEADEIDDLDDVALHVLATDAGRPVGSARIILLDETAKIGRVCVLQDQRGTGLGAALIRASLDIARQQQGVTRAKLGAQEYAIPFYEKLGFTVFGPVYLDAGIRHRDMELAL